VELLTGNLAIAAQLAHEAVELAGQYGRTESEVYALFHLGWIEGVRGNVAEAREACRLSLSLATESGGFRRGARLSLGYLESSLERYDAAWVYLDPANSATGEQPLARPVVHVPEMVEVLAQLGRTEDARARLTPFAARAAELNRRWALAAAAHCEGLILVAEGDLDAADGVLRDAVDQSEANGWPIPWGRALLTLGSVQRRDGHKADARATLRSAADLFVGAGAEIWRQRAERELARIGGRTSPAGGELSPTEREIVRLVAAGHSNKHVARDLHVSVRTVEWNLSKVYRKLNVSSRAQLVANYTSASKPGDFSG
jgi:ATP/maltotriose-dependent transcriptional regulator MalT